MCIRDRLEGVKLLADADNMSFSTPLLANGDSGSSFLAGNAQRARGRAGLSLGGLLSFQCSNFSKVVGKNQQGGNVKIPPQTGLIMSDNGNYLEFLVLEARQQAACRLVPRLIIITG